MKPFRLIRLAIAAGLCASPFLAVIAMTHRANAQEATFQNWSVTCDRDGFCTASTPDQRNAAGLLRVSRAKEKSALWEISVETAKDNPSLFGPVSLRIAGQRLTPLAANKDYAAFSNPDEFFLINSAALQPLFRRMIESRRIFFAFSAKNQKQIDASYSLNGLEEALLWIDERQDKIGSNRTAGPPAPRTPADAETATFDAEALALKVHARTADPEICPITPEKALGSIAIARIDETRILVAVACTHISHDTLSRLYVVDRNRKSATLQLWAVYSTATGWTGTDILPNIHFDEAEKTLSMRQEKSGLRDCAMRGAWHWEGDFFRMTDFAVKDDCVEESGDWRPIAVGNTPAK